MEIRKLGLQGIRMKPEAWLLESVRDIPFSIKRVYYIFDVAKVPIAVFHAHKNYGRV